jgi:hypothetical protein
LIRDPGKNCAPVYPWNFVRDNSIFGVVHAAGGYMAWADKHPACATIPDPGSDTSAWTNSFQNIQCYETLKVNAILNQIKGKNHLVTAKTTVPTLFGMNFQTVSVGEKLSEKSNSMTGGYLEAMSTPTPALLNEIKFTDAAIGSMVQELKDRGLYESTLIVITKHGQSPIDPNRYFTIPGHSGANGTTPATLLTQAGYLHDSESPLGSCIGATEDDVSLLWLKSTSETSVAVAILEKNAAAAGIGQIYYGGNNSSTSPAFRRPAHTRHRRRSERRRHLHRQHFEAGRTRRLFA